MFNNYFFNTFSKYILVFTIFFLFLSNSKSFTQEDNFENKIIYKIIFKNLNKAKKKDITPLILSQEGTQLDLALIDEDYQRLIGLGYFEDIVISTDTAYDERTNEPIKGMANLIFEFIEKPSIRKIIFRGNKKLSYAVLTGDITIKRGNFFDLSIVNSDISAIIEKYTKQGFNYVKVNYEIFQDEELKLNNKIDLIFKIDEGIETYVSEIIINGNNKISTFTLKNKMKTKERKFFGLQKGAYNEAVFNQDLEEIKKYYRDQGYYFIEINEPEINYYELEEKGLKKEIIRIKISLVENNQYTFGGIKLNGNKIFNEEELLLDAKLKKGQIFNYTKYQETKFTISKKYNDGGYIQTQVDDNIIIDEENKIISVEIKIVESKRSYIEAVYFKGNEKTKNYILERAVYTEVGEIFNSSKLMDSLIALYNLGFFLDVQYDIQQGSAPGLLKITYILEEQQTADVKFGLTIPATQWPPEVTLFVEINEKNLTGRELILSGRLEASLYKQGFSFSADDPWFFNYPWSLGASASFYHNWMRKILREISEEDKELYSKHNDGEDGEDDEIRSWFNEYYANDETHNRNYIGSDNESFINKGIHNVTFELAARTGYRFLKYFNVSGILSCSPVYTWLPGENGDIDEIASLSLRNSIGRWSIKNKISSTFSINTTKRRINPYEGFKFSATAAYTFGHYDSFFLGSKFTVYWKTLDLNFNDYPWANVMVFNAAYSMILPGFRNLGGELYGQDTYGRGPILYPTDYLVVDGMFSGRGWSNSLAGYSYLGHLRGYAKLDYSLEYRIPLHDKIIWLAGFIDMFNLLVGPYPEESENSWMWWKSDLPSYDAMGIDKWFGSIGAGIEITFPQLPLSFFVVKRFKINYYTGIEWMPNNIGGIDFVLSMVGYYF